MPCANKSLFLFTAEFPYGNKSETFLEEEIHFLAAHFNQVVIFPSQKSSVMRPLPEKVEVNNLLATEHPPSKKSKTSALIRHIGLVIQIMYLEIKTKGTWPVLRNSKILLDVLAQQLIRSERLSRIVSKKQNITFYDYWFINTTLALAILKKQTRIQNLSCRGHRFDIYDECFPKTGIPFREFTLRHLDKFFIVSEFGLEYVKTKVSKDLHHKLKLAYLGVSRPIQIPEKRTNEVVILSISSMLPFKQVEKIPGILSLLSIPVHWIHFGDGIQRHEVEKACENIPNHITVELKGHADNSVLLKFLSTQYVDLFISLSNSEGLPVSMMEAQSYGIPIAAYPISGIPEIVKNGITGHLLSLTDSDLATAKQIENILHNSFDRKAIQTHYELNFNSERNYTNFIHELCSSEE
jgi:glycosyltransferase involved in cell wall biosynthesis